MKAAPKIIRPRVAFAIGAHPDDIEFRMAGTLVLLRLAGWETHYWNLSSGNCGSLRFSSAETARRRRAEAQQAAQILRAHWHPPIARDLEIFYDLTTLRRVAAVIREVRPTLILTHPPVDYMEDHTATCRLAVTGAFARGMPNFRTSPARRIDGEEVTLYHCVPHGLSEPLGRNIRPGILINTASTHAAKMAALAEHRSQQDWLDRSQRMNSYLRAAEADSHALARMSKNFREAEGFWRHSHLGFCSPKANPLRDALGKDYLELSSTRQSRRSERQVTD